MTGFRAGEVWLAQFDTFVDDERAGRRPVVVISSNSLHALPLNTVMVVPLSSQDRGLVTQPRIATATSGLSRVSFARPEDMRVLDSGRLQRRLGHVSSVELAEIRKVVRYFLDL